MKSRKTSRMAREANVRILPVKPKSNALLDILDLGDQNLLPAFMKQNDEKKQTNIMQKTKFNKRLQRPRRSIAEIRTARQKFIRRPKQKPVTRQKETFTVISSGVFTLRLDPIHYATLVLDKLVDQPINTFRSSLHGTIQTVFDDLYPAYLRFLELMEVSPKVIQPDGKAGKLMHMHLQEVLGEDRQLDVFWDYESKKYQFAYLTFLPCGDEYNTFFYRPVKKQLNGPRDEKYVSLYIKSLKTLKRIGFMDWGDVEDQICHFEEEFEEDAYDFEDVEDQRRNFYKVKYLYESGKASDILYKIRNAPVLLAADIKRVSKYDPEHPVVQFAKAVLNLADQQKEIYDYAEQVDDGEDPYLRYYEQFAIFYDLDDYFAKHEEFINSVAQEGPQQPRLISYISADMPEIHDTSDDFTRQLASFYNQFCNLSEQLKVYKRNLNKTKNNQ